MSKCTGLLFPCTLTLLLSVSAARAEDLLPWCNDATAGILVGQHAARPDLARQAAKPDDSLNSTTFTKNLRDVGGLAFGYKGYTLSNTIERSDTLRFLQGLNPSLATPEIASAVEDIVRSRGFRSGAIVAGVVGTYFVIDAIAGHHAPSEDESKRVLRDDTETFEFGRMQAEPCMNRTPALGINRNDSAYDLLLKDGPGASRRMPLPESEPEPEPHRDLYQWSGDK